MHRHLPKDLRVQPPLLRRTKQLHRRFRNHFFLIDRSAFNSEQLPVGSQVAEQGRSTGFAKGADDVVARVAWVIIGFGGAFCDFEGVDRNENVDGEGAARSLREGGKEGGQGRCVRWDNRIRVASTSRPIWSRNRLPFDSVCSGTKHSRLKRRLEMQLEGSNSSRQ